MVANSCDNSCDNTFADGTTCDDTLAFGMWIIEQCDAKRARIDAEDEMEAEEEEDEWFVA